MLKISTQERLEQFVFLFIGVLFLLYISGMLLVGTKLEFDRNSARFRETKIFLSIPYRSTTRVTWLTQFKTDDETQWEVVKVAGSTAPSVWHGVAGRLNAEIRSLGQLDEMNQFTDSSRSALAQTIRDILTQPGELYDNFLEATAWFDCVLYDLPIPDDANEPIPEEAVLELLEQCKAKLLE